MAKTLNKVLLIGRLGKNPEIRYTPDGLAIANFSLATDEGYKGKDGNYQSNTEWHRIVAFGKLAEICGEYLTKGKQVYIEGRIQTRSWNDQNGDKKYSTEIIANNLIMLDSRQDSAPNISSSNKNSNTTTEKSDDDIPFWRIII